MNWRRLRSLRFIGQEIPDVLVNDALCESYKRGVAVYFYWAGRKVVVGA